MNFPLTNSFNLYRLLGHGGGFSPHVRIVSTFVAFMCYDVLMNIIVSNFGTGPLNMQISLYDSDESSSVFRASCEPDVEVFFELHGVFQVWDVIEAAVDSFRVEFDLLNGSL